jgi:hypothetical protein
MKLCRQVSNTTVVAVCHTAGIIICFKELPVVLPSFDMVGIILRLMTAEGSNCPAKNMATKPPNTATTWHAYVHIVGTAWHSR